MADAATQPDVPQMYALMSMPVIIAVAAQNRVVANEVAASAVVFTQPNRVALED